MLANLPGATEPGMKVFAVVLSWQSLPGGVAVAPFGAQLTGTGPKSMSAPVPACVYVPLHGLEEHGTHGADASAEKQSWALVALDGAVHTTAPAGEAIANVLGNLRSVRAPADRPKN
jgi:hypothetical protein